VNLPFNCSHPAAIARMIVNRAVFALIPT
jgi:hypothetical protein